MFDMYVALRITPRLGYKYLILLRLFPSPLEGEGKSRLLTQGVTSPSFPLPMDFRFSGFLQMRIKLGHAVVLPNNQGTFVTRRIGRQFLGNGPHPFFKPF